MRTLNRKTKGKSKVAVYNKNPLSCHKGLLRKTLQTFRSIVSTNYPQLYPQKMSVIPLLIPISYLGPFSFVARLNAAMANPQTGEGFTRIANEIVEHLAMPGINGSEYRISLFVIRKTYGFAKLKDRISLTQFQKGTLMERKQVVETVKSLVGQRLLVKERSSYRFNKNWEEWVVGKRTLRGLLPTTEEGLLPTKTRGQKPTHKRKKETITKEIAPQADAEGYTLEGSMKKLEDSSRRDLNIIALYFQERKPDLQTKEQFNIAMNRHLRAAKQLTHFNNNQILDAIPKAKRLNEGWTLETLGKILTK